MNDARTFARPSAAYASHEEAARALLRAAVDEFGDTLVLASSMGVEDMVLTDLIARDALGVSVATLDTGMLHPETLALVDTVRSHYGIGVEVWHPDVQTVAAFVAREGAQPMYRSIQLRHACCALRKLEPLERMLRGRRAWIAGLRREQSPGRAAAAVREVDAQGRVKLSPLLNWTLGDIWHYVAAHGVPYNPLHDQHYPSIGCAPCTRPISVGEDVRAGRWWWEQDAAKECGLHAHHDQQPASLVSPIHPIQRVDDATDTQRIDPGAPV